MPLALLATVFHAEGLWPWDVRSRTSQLGLATPLMRRRYRSLAQTGKVVIGYICEAAFQPASGRENYNPAHVMAGIGGTTDDEELVEACLKWQHELGLIAPALKKECPPNFAGSPGRVFCGGKSEDTTSVSRAPFTYSTRSCPILPRFQTRVLRKWFASSIPRIGRRFCRFHIPWPSLTMRHRKTNERPGPTGLAERGVSAMAGNGG